MAEEKYYHMKQKTSEQILNQIRALLHMTEERGCSADEAANAANLVEHLLTKYALTMADVPLDDPNAKPPVVRIMRTSGVALNRSQDWSRIIARYVSQMCFCKFIIENKTGMAWIGEEVDVTVASELHMWLVGMALQQVRESWRAIPKTERSEMSYLHYEQSFFDGYAQAIAVNINAKIEKRKAEEKVYAIVVHKEAEAKDFINKFYGNSLRSIPHKQRRAMAIGEEHGTRVGLKMPTDLNAPLGGA